MRSAEPESARASRHGAGTSRSAYTAEDPRVLRDKTVAAYASQSGFTATAPPPALRCRRAPEYGGARWRMAQGPIDVTAQLAGGGGVRQMASASTTRRASLAPSGGFPLGLLLELRHDLFDFPHGVLHFVWLVDALVEGLFV